MTSSKTGDKMPSYIYPHQVVNVRSKAELDQALEHFSHPMPMLDGSVHPKSPFAMRYMVEWVFPTLRWYCKAFNTPIPHWLEGLGWAEGLSHEDFKRIFGDNKPLRPKEWVEDAAHAGER
jgi:hypothetical protein